MAKAKYKLNDLIARDFTADQGTLDIYEVRRILAKAANQRMVRLEQGISKYTGKAYTYGAYDIARDYLARQGKGGKLRFSEQLGVRTDKKTGALVVDRGPTATIKEIQALQRFLESESSTVGGMRKIEKRRINTFVSKGIPKSIAESKEFYDFLNSSAYEHASKIIQSEQIMDAIGSAADSGAKVSEIVKAFEDYLAKNDNIDIKSMRKALNAATFKETKSEKRNSKDQNRRGRRPRI